jgi:phage N-6-adenine-methyltransferase
MMPAATTEWGTPPEIVDHYARLWAGGSFTLDAAASPELHVCDQYFTVDDDGLRQPWTGRVWCNPPYGRDEIKWVRKAINEVHAGRAELAVLLLPAKTGKPWFQDLVVDSNCGLTGIVRLRYPVAAVNFIRGRIRYVNPDGSQGNVAGYASIGVLVQAVPLGGVDLPG